ncbi:conjugal transfer protein TraV (plasmid) [Serratia marcescens]|nr:conjugal transfer protein TraV [Serratia marcescens]
MRKSLVFLSLLLTGCAGMNSEFEFDKPARDTGVWMSQADEMTSASAGKPGNAGGKGLNLAGYRLVDTGNIRLDVQTALAGSVVGAGRRYGTALAAPARQGDAAARPALTGGVVHAVSQVPVRQVSCSSPRCYPEPASAFRRPDGVARIWIAPYVSPDDNVHMGEVVYTVTKPANWHGVL